MHSLFRHEYKSMQKRSHPCDGCLCSESKVARLIETECYYTAVLLHGDRTRGLYLNCSSFQTVTGLSYIIQHRLCFVFLFGGVRRGLSTPAVVPQQRCWKMLALCSSGCDVTPPGNVKHWLDFHPSSLRSASSFFLQQEPWVEAGCLRSPPQLLLQLRPQLSHCQMKSWYGVVSVTCH